MSCRCTYFGTELVLFRDSDGAARVLDAYCPHLGAHLGYGGKVEDDCIRCPFHAWRFDGDGRCVEVPYANKIPPLAQLDAWPVFEANGLVMVYHHMDARPPAWTPPVLPEYGADELDRLHAAALEDPHAQPGDGGERRRLRALQVRARHARTTGDARRDRRAHLPRAVACAIQHAAGRDRRADRVGFVRLRLRHRALHRHRRDAARVVGDADRRRVRGRAVLVQGEEDRQRQRRRRTSASAFIAEIERQLGQDIPIWEHKTMKMRPVLCDGDGPIGLFRRWAKQFYISAPGSATAVAGEE